MATVITSQMLSLIDGRLREVMFDTNNAIPMIHQDLFRTKNTDRAYEIENRVIGVPEATQIQEGEVYTQQNIKQDTAVTINIKKFGFVINVSRELILDNMFDSIQDDVARAMRNSMNQTRERRAINVFNNAFVTTATVAQDGLSLCSTAHTLAQGGTQSNKASVDSALDIDTLWTGRNTVQTTTGQSTLYDAIYPSKYIVVPQALERRANELVKSEWVPQSTENTANVIGALTNYQVRTSPLLTSTTAWFLVADKAQVPQFALRFYQREALNINALFNLQGDSEVGMAIDKDTYSWRCRERYEVGIPTWYGVYGNVGA